jgi:hypothetical protein
MRTLLLVVLFSLPAFADAGTDVPDAGVLEVAVVPATAPSTAVVVDGGVLEVIPADPAVAASMVKTVFVGVKEGNWWLVAAALLLLVVGFLRGIGRKFHDWLPDNNIMDKPLIFFYDTKVGGWILNWLTATAGGVGTAMAAGVSVDWSLWKSVLMVSTSASALFELYKDIKEWVVAKMAAKKKAAEEEAAKKAAVTGAPAEPPKP